MVNQEKYRWEVLIIGLFPLYISLLWLKYYSKSVGTTHPGFEFLIVKIVKYLELATTSGKRKDIGYSPEGLVILAACDI